MGKVSLAVKYRPQTFEDVTEQNSTKIILTQQLASNEIQHAYLFVGGAGTGKTTCARIFAQEINKHKGQPIELDAASHSGVDDVRDIIQQAKLKSLDSEYKVFIVDEAHALSSNAWQAFLKLLEEPPAKSIFIFATTDPQKIPKTILSRVQRYTFNRISQQGIVNRLWFICESMYGDARHHISNDAIEYLAKIADGGMRDAITLMDKCLSYSEELTIDTVVKVLGVANYTTMMDLTNYMIAGDRESVISIIEDIYNDGVDLKQFVRQYINFVLDAKKAVLIGDMRYTQLPETEEIKEFIDYYRTDMELFSDDMSKLLTVLVNLNNDIKYDSSPKSLIEICLLRFCEGDKR